MLDEMAMRRMGSRTQHDYVRHVRAFAAFLGRSPDTATAEDVRRFQLHQREHGVGESVIGATVSALRFLFDVTLDRPDLSRKLVLAPRPRKLPDVLSVDEGAKLLEAAPGIKYRAALGVAYGAGLRVSEVAQLRADDIDSKRMLTGIRNNDGFVPGTLVVAEMMRLGFTESQIRAAVRRLAEHRLIETPHAHFREIEVKDDQLAESYQFRATSVGIYHARYWVRSFSFLDAMCLDTPIFDREHREAIFKYASSFEIKDRLKKATAFLSYLEATWYEANFDMNYFDFKGAVDNQKKSFESVERFVSKGTRA